MKHPLIALLLASTSTIALHANVDAQTQSRLSSAFKPSVEVHLEALDLLRSQPQTAPTLVASTAAQANPAPITQTLPTLNVLAPQPLVQPLAQNVEASEQPPQKMIMRQPVSQARELPPSRYEERNRAIQAAQQHRDYNIASNGLPRDAQGRIIPPALPGIKAPAAPIRSESKDSGWLADTSNYVGGLFSSDKAVEQTEPAPLISQARSTDPTQQAVPLEEKLPFKKPLPVFTENNSIEPNNALPSIQTPKPEPQTTKITAPTPTESPKPIIQKTESSAAPATPPPSTSQAGNIASYDGLELAEGIQGVGGMPPIAQDLRMPPSTMRQEASPTPPPAAIALPKPKSPVGEEILGHVSDDAPVGKTLRDPFEDGAVRYAEASPPAAPQPTPIEIKKPIATPPPAPIESPSAPTPQPEAKQEDSGWMDSLKNTVTGYFSDEETAPTPVPELNKNPDLKREEMQPPPVIPSTGTATTTLPSLSETIKADPTPAGLPSLTKLTGDPEVMKQSEERKVITAPLPSADDIRKPINTPPTPIQPIVEVPKVEAPKTVAKKPEPKVEKPKEKIAAPVTPVPTPEPKAQIKAEVKAVEPPTKKPEPVTPPLAPTVAKKLVIAENKIPEPTASPVTPPTPAQEKTAEEQPPTTEIVPPVVLKRDESSATASLNQPAVEAAPITKKAAANTSLNFAVGESKVPAYASGSLNEIAAALKQSTSSRVTIQAYASAAEGQDALARRVALARGLAVRAYLIEQGVSALRINVKSLGTKSSGGNPDRVDVMMSEGS